MLSSFLGVRERALHPALLYWSLVRHYPHGTRSQKRIAIPQSISRDIEPCGVGAAPFCMGSAEL